MTEHRLIRAAESLLRCYKPHELRRRTAAATMGTVYVCDCEAYDLTPAQWEHVVLDVIPWLEGERMKELGQ